MVLVDTAVWIDHFDVGVPDLVHWLDDGQVIGHRWVLGELLMGGGIPAIYVDALSSITTAQTLPDEVLLAAIDRWKWRGLSWVDLQLILSANAGGHRLWTRDRATRRAAEELGIAFLAAD